MGYEAGRNSSSHFSWHSVALDLHRLRRRTGVNSLARRGYFASYRLIAAVEIGA